MSGFLPWEISGHTVLAMSSEDYASVTIPELVSGSAKYDGRKVVFRGEVIGDIMVRKDGVWINVLDQGVAMGVFMSTDLANKIRFTGKYGYRGDLVEVRGAFNHACPVHSGEPDVHCEGLVVLEQGGKVPTAVSLPRIYLATGSLLLAGILFLTARSKGRLG